MPWVCRGTRSESLVTTGRARKRRWKNLAVSRGFSIEIQLTGAGRPKDKIVSFRLKEGALVIRLTLLTGAASESALTRETGEPANG